MNIGIFGGTFDPPHLGHLRIADAIVEKQLVDKIVFMPAPSPPHKPNLPITEFRHRFKMVSLAIEGHTRLEVSDFEATRKEKPSYTYDTVVQLKKEMSDHNLFFIIGGDSLKQLHTWYKSKELIEISDFITYPRPDEEISLEYLNNFWSIESAKKLFDTVQNFDTMDFASTNIRKLIKNGSSRLKKLLPEPVIKYIKEEQLYIENIG